MKSIVKYHLLLSIVCLAVYLPSLWNDFQMGWDDQWMVFNRYTEDGFTQENLKSVFTDYHYGQYGPVNEIVYMAIYKAFGYNPFIYHLYSLLLHIANCCLLFTFLRILASKFQHSVPQLVAFAATLLFAVHPLQVESIAWISASKIPLYTFFSLLAFLAYLQFARTEKLWYYLAAFVLFVFAFGSKEQSIVLPATLLLLDWALGRCRTPENKWNWQQILLEKLPFILLAVFAALQIRSHQSMEYTAQVAGYPLWQRLVFCCYSLVVYAGRLVLPVNLLYIYPFPMTPGGEMPAQYFIYPAVVVAGVYLLCAHIKKIPLPVIFGLLFYSVNMSLMLHIVTMPRFMITADRYVYLGSTGLFFIAAWYGVPWLQKMTASSKKWLVAVAACYLLYLGGYAHYRTYAWKDSDTVKRDLRDLIDADATSQEQEIQQNP